MKINNNVFIKLSLANVAPEVHVLDNCFMQQKINVIFTKRVLELNGRLGFDYSLSSCNMALILKRRLCGPVVKPLALKTRFLIPGFSILWMSL